jgi:hypothetical protein
MKRFMIINALIWASVILLVSYFAKDLTGYKYIFGILVFASGLQVSLLSNLSQKADETSCSNHKWWTNKKNS